MNSCINDPQAEDHLARFLYNSGEYATSKGEVKFRAFLLPKGKTILSVFQIRNLEVSDVWNLEATIIAKMRGKNAKAYADFLVEDVYEVEGLSLDPDNTPPRHAHVIGFPEDKGAQKLKAMELASRQPTLRMRP